MVIVKFIFNFDWVRNRQLKHCKKTNFWYKTDQITLRIAYIADKFKLIVWLIYCSKCLESYHILKLFTF